VDAGDVLIHHSYDAHQNHVAPTGCTLVNLPLPPGFPIRGCVRIKDTDAIVRLAAKDLLAAISCLLVQAQEEVRPMEDWPDVLAAALVSSPKADLAAWAARIGIAQSSLSRGFKQVYGIHPSRFGLEAKARRALTMVDGNTHSLADIAQQCGFADQPHMTRTFTRFIGWSPGQWRRQVKHVQ
jgi:AraC-like DNA-binding protein